MQDAKHKMSFIIAERGDGFGTDVSLPSSASVPSRVWNLNGRRGRRTMLGAVPGALYRSSSLFSTNDIVQDAQIDLARLSKALHSKQNDYDRTHPRRDAKRQLQLARATVQELEQDDIEKDIICDVQVARRSSKSALGASATRLLQIEDQVKRGTIGTKRTLGSLHRRLAALDRAIADKVASDDGYVKFARRQTKQEHRVVALETQMSASNVKLSTLRMEMRTLKTSLEDLTHSNQILTSTLVKLVRPESSTVMQRVNASHIRVSRGRRGGTTS